MTTSLPPGIQAARTLEAHTSSVWSVAFDPTGRVLATGGFDSQVKLWEAKSGELLHTLEGHERPVGCLSFDSKGQRLASAGWDKIVRLWDVATGRPLLFRRRHKAIIQSIAFEPQGRFVATASDDRKVKFTDCTTGDLQRTLGHDHQVWGLAFHPAKRMLATACLDGTARLWELESGRLLATFGGNEKGICSVAFDPAGRTLATASTDATVRIWEVTTGRLLRSLEGHTGPVGFVSFSPDGRFLVSTSLDRSVRLWHCDTWEPVAVLQRSAFEQTRTPAAFHPTLPLLAVPAAEAKNGSIHLLELDYELLTSTAAEAKTTAASVHHTTAKIVLVGDSGVGKTGLGWRLTHSEFREHSSTHGQQFWVLKQLGAFRRDGTQCEAVLWDLAGQPDYRLIHALFLDDADLALILFDPTDSREPLRGVEFWLKQLKGSIRPTQSSPGAGASQNPVAARKPCPTILVAARADRGAPTLTRDEIEAYCRQRGIDSYVRTSAKDGEGLPALVDLMKQLVAWENKEAITTTDTFKRIKDYVLRLKQDRTAKPLIATPIALREELRANDPAWRFTDREMLTALGHLENYGYVKRLRRSNGEDCILLAPELLNNLAASFVLEARRNPKGLGSLEERRLLSGDYPFHELKGLTYDECDTLLDSAALLFLQHNVCFRESDPLNGQSYLVFPELINLNKPLLQEEIPTEEGVAYTVTGAIENVYASLVVLLGYTHTFTHAEQWRSQARYEMNGGLVCGFRQEAERDGELDFVLYFGKSVDHPVRKLFEGLFESFLARRNVTVSRYEPIVCPECRHVLPRALVRQRLREDKDFAFCPECSKKLKLPRPDKPIQLTRQEHAAVEAQRWTADARSYFEQAIFRVQAHVKDQNLPTPECFISYAWGDKQQEHWVERTLALDLQKAGLKVVLDLWESTRIGGSVPRFIERIEKCDRVVVVGTPLYRKKYENKDTTTGYVVAAEVDLISNRLLGTEAEKETVLPAVLAGDKKISLPPLLHSRVYADFRDASAYFRTAFDLILSLYQIPPTDPAVADLLDAIGTISAA